MKSEAINILSPFLGMAIDHMDNLKEKQELHKKRILEQWEFSKQLPRKKKKELRKRLHVEWAIATWEI